MFYVFKLGKIIFKNLIINKLVDEKIKIDLEFLRYFKISLNSYKGEWIINGFYYVLLFILI